MSFKTCNCGHIWGSRDSFLSDPEVKLLGYQVNFEALKEGFFLFNHLAPGCQTTFSLAAGTFFDLYTGPVFSDRLAGTRECGDHCFHRDDLGRCPAKCDCAFARDVMRIVVEWPKMTARRGD